MKRLISILLIVMLVAAEIPVTPVLAAEKQENIYIRNTREFMEFAKKCNSDAWSYGKTVVLTANLDLTGVDFEPIQVFAGTFDGNNHTISGVEYVGSGYAEGFFRFITASGTVKNLTIQGSIASDNQEECTGGICGVNAGKLIRCTFRGVVSGKSETGGIAGENESTGSISYCYSYGSITGYDGTGGIAGRNFGTIISCCNNAGVNSDNSWLIEADEGGLEWILENRNAVSSENGTDIGGIAGFSKGLILNCTNRGVVGYEHNGYNVGGIVGRQSGQVLHCVNEGKVYGRKDVGGIVGQMEPFIRVDETEQLSDAMQELHDRIEKLLDDVDGTQNALSGDFDELQVHSDNALDQSREILDELGDFVDENVDSVNDMMERMDYVLEHLPEIMDNVKAAVERVDDASKSLERVNEDLNILDPSGEINRATDGNATTDYQAYQEARARLEIHSRQLEESMSALSDTASDIEALFYNEQGERIAATDFLKDSDRCNRLIDEVLELSRHLAQAGEAAGAVINDINTINRILSPYLEQGMKAANEDIKKAIENLSEVSMFLQIAGELTEDVVDYLNAQPDITFSDLGDDFHGNVDALYEELDAIKSVTSRIGDHMDYYSDVVLDDFRRVNDQVNTVVQLLAEKIDNMENFYLDEDPYEDISKEDIEGSTDGKVSGCRNTGHVAGDVNVGGIAGSMAIDEEDPEDNAAGAVELLSGNRYMTKCIIDKSQNEGIVKAKKDGVGGIVGFMRLGIVNDCKAYGSVESTEGEYIGGVCGQSLALIQDCWSLVSLKGSQYVGGIAGYGNKIHNCYAMTVINPDAVRKGAIAGWVETEEDARVGYGENISNNYYVSDTLNGVDQVNYVSVAEPITYMQLLSMEGVPIEFQHLHIDFVADDKLVERVYVEYGQRVSEIRYPAVPVINGSYGKWETIPYDSIEANMTVEAEYFDNITTLKSVNEGQEKSFAMADGVFGDGAQLHVVPDEEMDGMVVYDISISNGGLEKDKVTRIRILNPYTSVAGVEVYQNEAWENVDYKTYGQYLEVEMKGTRIKVRIVEKKQPSVLLYGILAGTAVLLFGAAVILRKRRAKGKK